MFTRLHMCKDTSYVLEESGRWVLIPALPDLRSNQVPIFSHCDACGNGSHEEPQPLLFLDLTHCTAIDVAQQCLH